jgi:hypothetical protein
LQHVAAFDLLSHIESSSGFRAFVLSPALWNAVVFDIPPGCFRDKLFTVFHPVFQGVQPCP